MTICIYIICIIFWILLIFLIVQYYSLDITYFKSSLDSHLLDLLWNKYWVNTLSSSPWLGNADFVAGQISDLGNYYCHDNVIISWLHYVNGIKKLSFWPACGPDSRCYSWCYSTKVRLWFMQLRKLSKLKLKSLIQALGLW